MHSSSISDKHRVDRMIGVRIGTPPHPLTRRRVCPPLRNQMVGDTLACRWGGGESQIGRGDRHCGTLGTIYVLCGDEKRNKVTEYLTLFLKLGVTRRVHHRVTFLNKIGHCIFVNGFSYNFCCNEQKFTLDIIFLLGFWTFPPKESLFKRYRVDKNLYEIGHI